MFKIQNLLHNFVKNQAKQFLYYRNIAKKRLPKPPVPSLSHTFSRYLEYASAIAADDKQLEETTERVSEFLTNGTKFQDRLLELAEKAPNWVNCFWLPEMYLKPRYPLTLYSNPAYVFPKQNFQSEADCLKYTAWLVRGMLEFKDTIDNRLTEKDYVDKNQTIPMCMDQYDRLLTSYRQAVHGEDVLLRSPVNEDEHIMVMCQNQAFAVAVKVRGHLLAHSEIFYQLTQIAEAAKNRSKTNVAPIACATAGERDLAADFWAQAKLDPMNQESLNIVTNSIFNICLDLDPCPENKTIANEGQFILHGYGSNHAGLNRWYEHTIQLVVAINGTNGLCIEHSVAEGIVIIKMAEHALRFEKEQRAKKQIAAPKLKIKPRCLRWRVTSKMYEILAKQIAIFDELAGDLELVHTNFSDFGKEKIKSFGVSPDGFVQLSMQLAHYRMYNRVVSTYESASIRRFCLGRVDNIRSATPQALEWAKAMDSPRIPFKDKIRLFKEATVKQAMVTKENITGYGIDNHLCALSTICAEAAKKKEIPKQFEVFADQLWYDTMRFPLSTSQVTTSSDFDNSYLCYGPVVKDGYGNAYNIQNNKIIFATSARKSYRHTDAARFVNEVCRALRDMSAMVEKALMETK
uniref:Choline O-acetyltransferase n=1 Tax=Panagrolaimus superbus TaxID=310955 RepID=A0A914YPX6_9BILA